MFTKGDRVRNKHNGLYLGTVTDVIEFVRVRNGGGGFVEGFPASDLELAEPLSPETVWSQVPILVMQQIMGMGSATGLYEFDRRGIRHECYRLLGGAGIKIDEDVKERVREVIKEVAALLSVPLR